MTKTSARFPDSCTRPSEFRLPLSGWEARGQKDIGSGTVGKIEKARVDVIKGTVWKCQKDEWWIIGTADEAHTKGHAVR
jgi:hypothetical protein